MLQSVETRDLSVRSAREAFQQLGADAKPAFLPDQRVVHSWERCLSSGLDSHALRARGATLPASALKEARDRNTFLLSQARGVLNHLYEQIRSTGSVVILADSTGLILESLGDPGPPGNPGRDLPALPGATRRGNPPRAD